MVADWVLVYNAAGQFQDVAAGSGKAVSVRDLSLFADFMNLVRSTDHGQQ
jgi:hypothetical protein